MPKKILAKLGQSKSRTLILFGAILLLVLIIIIIFSLSKPSPLKTQASHTSKIPQITAIPGEVTSERYQTLQEEDNRRRAEQARKTGGSAVATIIGSREQDLLSKRESFGIEGELIKASDCKCLSKEGEISALNPALATQLISEIEANPNKALQLMQEHPGLAKALCEKNPDLALKVIQNNKAAAKLMLTECPAMAKRLAEANPALFKELMLENPDLAKKIAQTEPGVLEKLMEADPAFANQLAKTNPDIVKKLLLHDPAFAKKMAALNPNMVKNLMLDDPAFAKEMAIRHPDIVGHLMQNDPNFKRAILEKDPSLNAYLQKTPYVAPGQQLATERTAIPLNEQQQKQMALLLTNMENQSKTFLQNWSTVSLQNFVQGDSKEDKNKDKHGTRSNSVAAGEQGHHANSSGQVIIKAGTILFAVLDTAVNSDEPGPVMATVTQGPFKGAKVVGNMQFAKQPSGSGNRPDKVVLNFSTLNLPEFPKSLMIKGVAIDPDTARTALATDVDHHYLLRYGSLFAASFMTGYARVITSEGTVQTTNMATGSTTTTSPQLSTRQQIFAALGQVGQQFGQAASTYFNSPNTITVDAGTGIGLLLLEDVTTSG